MEKRISDFILNKDDNKLYISERYIQMEHFGKPTILLLTKYTLKTMEFRRAVFGENKTVYWRYEGEMNFEKVIRNLLYLKYDTKHK